MKMISPALANSLWQVSSYPTWWRFKRTAEQVRNRQYSLLKNYLERNKETNYGRRYGFDKVTSVTSFQKNIPITTYDDYLEEINEIWKGRENVLTGSPVRMFELSSGSTAPSKKIPYTDQLHREFQTAISAWIYNLFLNYPDLKNGPAYWSISPLSEGQKFSPGGIPIGFEEDSGYLGQFGKKMIDPLMAVPGVVKKLEDMDNFRYVTLLYLLAQPNLRIISIWNPTFLQLLLKPLNNWWSQLIDDIKIGKINLPQSQHNNETYHLKPNPKRALNLSRVDANNYLEIWPQLKLISCWMDGFAKAYAEDLRSDFPGVLFQGKGLISTEAFVSFPLVGLPGAALAVNSHFFEFLPVNNESQTVDEGNPHLAHHLEEGKRYSVVVTTGGGFYRYHLQDVIEIVDFYQQIPLLRFVGKIDLISDWFGEKLNERFVSTVLQDVCKSLNLQPVFALVAPCQAGAHFRYRLFIELTDKNRANLNQKKLVDAIEEKFCGNFHYAYCRKLGQISKLDLQLINNNAREAYLAGCKKRGQRLGEIKPRVLETTAGWENQFKEY